MQYAERPDAAPPASDTSSWFQQIDWHIVAGVVFGILVVGAMVLLCYLAWRDHQRSRCRSCKPNGRPMHRLAGADLVRLLDAGQQREQDLGSRTFAVAVCTHCDDVRVTARANPTSSCLACTRCAYVTARKTRQLDTVDGEPTLRITETCEHCGHARTYLRPAPSPPESHRNGVRPQFPDSARLSLPR